jgi:hypothetical protein
MAEMNLDEIERIAKAAQADWTRDSSAVLDYDAAIQPDVVLSLVARVRELERQGDILEQVWLAAKAVEQHTDILGDGIDTRLILHPLVRRLLEALDRAREEL